MCLHCSQGSHFYWKTLENGKAFSSQGKVRKFWTDWKSQGETKTKKYWKSQGILSVQKSGNHGSLCHEAVNTVCLGFSDEFIEFSQSWFYRWFLAKIMDFGGEDEGFLAKITDFWRRLRIFRRRLQIFQRRLQISLSLPMFTVHTNEWGTCTCLHWACADILMRESPLLSMCRCSTGHVQTC